MSPFNDSVERPSIKKKPTTTSAVGNLVKLGALGVVGLGLVITNALLPVTPGQDPQRDTVTAFLAHELEENCAGTGCLQIIAGVTEAGDIYTLSGSVAVGDPRFPVCSISSTGAIQGSNCVITAGVTLPDPLVVTTLEAQTISGATVHAQDELTSSGAFVVDENQTVTLNGLTYNFPSTVGNCLSQSGCLLTLTGANLDTLVWAPSSGGGGGGTQSVTTLYQTTSDSDNQVSGTLADFNQTYDIEANSIAAGDVIRIVIYTEQNNANCTNNIRVGGNTVITSPSENGGQWFEITLTFRTIGASASVEYGAMMRDIGGGVAGGVSSLTLDTTSAITIGAQGRKDSGAGTVNHITQFTVTKYSAPSA